MTIDERLEKLAERHEALTQSVELLTSDVRQMAAENRVRDAKFEEHREHMVQILERLTDIVEDDDNRINGLEEGK